MNYKVNENLRENYDLYYYSSTCDFLTDSPLNEYQIDCKKFFEGWKTEVSFC